MFLAEAVKNISARARLRPKAFPFTGVGMTDDVTIMLLNDTLQFSNAAVIIAETERKA